MSDFIIRGNICYSVDKNQVAVMEKGYLVCINDICQGLFKELPEKYKGLVCTDYGDRMIIPGMTDLHLHAPQYPFRGMAMDLELIDWLNAYAFAEEAKYQDLPYADKAYDIFANDLVHTSTTRACIFGTRHREATLLLMDKLEKAGFSAYVGKVNMDRNGPENLCEKSAEESLEETRKWLDASEKFANVKPMLTPRFIPSCTEKLLDGLSLLQKEYGLPVQSHLSENVREIAWVKSLCPESAFYGDAYDRHDLFGGEGCPTIMAHCVHSGEEEIDLMKKQGVFIAHCPESNTNLTSGIAPVRLYLDNDLHMGLGSDIAAGSALSLFKAMAMAVQCSKLRWRLVDESLKPLSWKEAFYLATKGGGSFFGKVGSFEEGYEFDAVVLDDSDFRHPQELTMEERMERFIYLSGKNNIYAKYIKGKVVVSAGCCVQRRLMI